MQRRQQLLEQLVRDGPLTSAEASELRDFGWGSDVELVLLSRADLASRLERFTASELSARELHEWADSIESREDIGFEREHERMLKEFIFQLANPEIHEELTATVAEDWVKRLRAR